ncbi:MAG: SUMF1/EgtB/PvdO family nonheme iron enzyme [Bacteroidales bacterium]|nr:SUMF1/EgtB/PvdO family nonheme iron enzyme [Bacteroidales bacterium]
MSSIVEGYSYDVFISYRQKDNKYDGWVTEFVDNLKRELDSMFKDEVSVYFDINPQDGLLETHDVDASLERKLKCLIFIPIISRTYCDPRSFAWDHEFKAFIEHASLDQFGLKITLPNGNVANRILPVRINDLDNADIKLLESILGGILRGVDFIYKSAGVNRPLRSKEDNPHDNLNHTIYRDQINKVALTVRDIIESMKVSVSPELAKQKEIQIKESEEKKKIKVDESTGNEVIEPKQVLRTDKIEPEREKGISLLMKTRILIPTILGTIAILVITVFLLHRHSKVKWAREEALPEIEQLVDIGKYVGAYDLALKAEKYIPDDPELIKLWPRFSTYVNTVSDPLGASVYRRDYNATDTNWIFVGETPLDSIRYPYSISMIKLEKDGFQTVYDATSSTLLRHRNYLLDSIGTLPKNMVHIPGIKITFNRPSHTDAQSIDISDFLIDKFEVTNTEYKAFIDSGGYLNKQFWDQPFIIDGKTIAWEEAMSLFIDKSGRKGPSTWEGGDFSKGKDNYPVSGVSWYEAAAYAKFIGKSLPTVYHWLRAAGFDYGTYLPREVFGFDLGWYNSFITLRSNLNGQALAPVGTYRGMTGYGTLDMVGNVREWCWNEEIPGNQRNILGGGWNDPTYMAMGSYVQPPFDRSQTNGFRCVSYLHIDENLAILKNPLQQSVPRDFMQEKPASDQQLEIFRRMFAYDKTNLNAVIESEDKSDKYWIKQKISFDATYNNERVLVYLFLPKNNKPPYQTVVYFPGSGALNMLSSDTLQMHVVDFLIKNGRAVIYPIYKGTYERKYKVSETGNTALVYREHVIQWYKDFARSIDYLESRVDIDTSKLAYYGYSWGGRLGPLMIVLENRIKVCILYVAGLAGRHLPEVDPFNYANRVKIPVLMLNGKYDATFPYETSQKPLYELLGTSPENKHIFTYESGHFVPKDDLIKETLNWLDKYFGPIK